MMVSWLWIAMLLTAAPQENLLVNPGFEQLNSEQPLGWDLFVQPQDGALGRADAAAYSGVRSAMLTVPTPYPNEPMNNWSQALFADVAGKTLRVSGAIKTENAIDAALWVQCWQRQPVQILSTSTTSDSTKIESTSDWTPVSMDVAVPKGTDFVIVRCVLRGVGTAWFDDISAEIAAPETTEPKDRPRADDTAPEQVAAALTLEDAAPSPSPSPPARETTGLDRREDEALKALLDANKALAETVTVLQQSNSALRDQFILVEEELEALRDQLRELQKAQQTLTLDLPAAPRAPVEAPEPEPAAAPRAPEPLVLVPHGANKTEARQ